MLVGGGGEQVTLRLVARYADANNVGSGIENVRRKEASCSSTARRSAVTPARSSGRPTSGRSSSATRVPKPRRVHAANFAHNGNAKLWTDQPVGTPEDVAERLLPYLDIGYRHLVAGFPSPYDEESMTRFATEVRPILERA